MTADQDPPRWVDPDSDAPDALRELLCEARADLPDEVELASVAAALGPLLGPAAPPAAPPNPAPVSAPSPATGMLGGAAAKIVGGLALVGAVGGGLWFASHHHASAPSPRAPLAAPVQAQTHVEPTRVAPIGPAQPSAAPHALAVPAASAPAALASRATRPAAPAAGLDEAQLLQAAQSALKTDPARALALTREHKRRFPHGVLSQEREVIAIEALDKLDQAAAKERADQFRKEYPGSAHESKVGATVGAPQESRP